MKDFKNKKVLIVGMAKSGVAVMDLMLKLGANITVYDAKEISILAEDVRERIKQNNIIAHFGEEPKPEEKFDAVIMSPGVNPEKPFIQNAINNGAELIGELELAFRLAKGKFVAITGTNGKTTTTSLTGAIFKAAGRKTEVVGNIGVPVTLKALESTEDTWFVTETSSYQLQTITEYHPVVSAVLNVTPDHLDRHHTFENYKMTKARIFENATPEEYLILNYDDKVCFDLAKYAKSKVVPFSRRTELPQGAFLKGDMLVIKDFDGKEYEICNRNELQIIGDHNIENALAAAAVSFYAGVDADSIRRGIITFKGVAHRMEFVEELNGVKYYNDSKGTNVDSTIVAINAVKKNIILIAGGDSKGQTFDELAKALGDKVKLILLFGRDAHFIEDSLKKVGFTKYIYKKNLKECVDYAHDTATKGDTVLLSPACASWDMYPRFEVRGDEFKDIVRSYK